MTVALAQRDLPRIGLAIFDIDGTLVRPDKSLTAATVAAFGRLRDAGIVPSLISARPPTGMMDVAHALGITTFMGAFNGGTIVGSDGAFIQCHHINSSLTDEVLRLGRAAAVDVWLFADGQWYVLNTDNRRVVREGLSSGLKPTVVPDLSVLATAADKIVFVSENPLRLQQLEADIRAVVEGRATIDLSQPYLLDVTAERANKGEGVATLADLIGLPLSEAVVIGDMANDLRMFARAGFSIAMGQAPGYVRTAANFVTDTDTADGAAKAIDKIILPRARGRS